LSLSGCNFDYKTETESNGIRLTISSPDFNYKVGDVVTVTATLKNISGKTIILECPSGISEYMNVSEYGFDIEVDGIWMSEVKQELRVERWELGPGKEIQVEYSFSPRQEPHTISIIAYSCLPTSINSVSLPINYGITAH
jgi:hypothetical protein